MRGFVVSAVVAFLVGGCAAAPDLSEAPPVPEADAPPSALQELRATFPTAGNGPYQMTFTVNGQTMNATVDEANRATEVRMSQPIPGMTATVTVHMLDVGDKEWLKVDMPAAIRRVLRMPDKWMLIDESKRRNTTDNTPVATGDILTRATQVTSAGTGKYTGTLDLAEDAGELLSAEEAAKLGSAAKAVPFEATAQDGHLTSVTVKIPKLGTHKFTLFGYGITPDLAEPAAEKQTAMPPQAYALIGNSL